MQTSKLAKDTSLNIGIIESSQNSLGVERQHKNVRRPISCTINKVNYNKLQTQSRSHPPRDAAQLSSLNEEEENRTTHLMNEREVQTCSRSSTLTLRREYSEFSLVFGDTPRRSSLSAKSVANLIKKQDNREKL